MTDSTHCTYIGPEGPCPNPIKIKRLGLCGKHAARLYRHGSTELILPTEKRVMPFRLDDESVTYRTMHSRLTMWLGPAREQRCVDCGKRAQQWSYEGGDPSERAGFTSYGHPAAYSTDTDYYRPRCVKCHKAHDYVKRTEPHPNATISNETVIEIFTSTEPHKVICDRLSISRALVMKIRRRERWTWLTRDLPNTEYETLRPRKRKDL